VATAQQPAAGATVPAAGDESGRDDSALDTTRPYTAMMRSPRVWIIVALVALVAVVSLAGWISRRTAPSHEVLTPTLVQLVRQSEPYEGERVRVTGDVRVFEADTPGEYYVLEEGGQYRVAIHGLQLATLRALTNGRMTIEGVFQFEDRVGRYIDVTDWATPSVSPGG
jgi:hypothetical protein